MPSSRFVIVDDHPLFRDALRQALARSMHGVEILEAGSIEELNDRLDSGPEPDLVLLDLSMPGVHGLSGLMFLRAQHPAIPVIVVSASDDPSTIRACIDFGASGFVPKSRPVDEIRTAVKAVMEGQVWVPPDIDLKRASDNGTSELALRLATLTPQQVRVLMMLGEGLLNKQIAYELGVSEATVKAHVSAILTKLGVDSRTQAVIAVNKLQGDWPRAPSVS